MDPNPGRLSDSIFVLDCPVRYLLIFGWPAKKVRLNLVWNLASSSQSESGGEWADYFKEDASAYYGREYLSA